MGIPSYFSYVSKHHNIVSKIKNSVYTDNLYFDCNSTIYNAIHKLNATNETPLDVIYEKVIHEILEYLTHIIARKTIFIAFDGVAPFAKMKQQRERRHRSAILSMYEKELSKNEEQTNMSSIPFDKASITPGTGFMKNLDRYMIKHLSIRIIQFAKSNNHPVPNIIFSGPMEVGEGEHKLFEYIRNHPEKHSTEETHIYGMDADLIILSLQHTRYCKSIFLFREDFDDHLIQLNIDKMTDDIVKDIGPRDEKQISRRITDYILMSFILGNDFLPHSPFLNIRTTGIKHLLKTYKDIVETNPDFYLTTEHNDCIIIQKNLKRLCSVIAQHEKQYLTEEYHHRNKMQYFRLPDKMEERHKDILLRIPQNNRERELRIQPHLNNNEWRRIYYETLFRTKPTREFKKRVCVQYLSGLQWCLSYYTSHCIDTNWDYPYHYPPLFSDLIQYIPSMNCNYFSENPCKEFVSSIEQLCYVLPPSSYNLLPEAIRIKLIQYWKIHGIHYNVNDITDVRAIPLQWEYCTYLWEAHPLLPDFPKNMMKQLIYI